MNRSILARQNLPGMTLDLELLLTFEANLNPTQPEINAIPCRVLGYGEISTVFALEVDGLRQVALKRMSIFETAVELQTYLIAYETYHRLLTEEVGINLPPNGYVAFVGENGRPLFYIIQKRLNSAAMGQNALHELP